MHSHPASRIGSISRDEFIVSHAQKSGRLSSGGWRKWSFIEGIAASGLVEGSRPPNSIAIGATASQRNSSCKDDAARASKQALSKCYHVSIRIDRPGGGVPRILEAQPDEIASAKTRP